MNKRIRKEELVTGDILLFSYVKDDLESKLIALLSQSDVSHAAMVYEDTTKIIEEVPDYATINELQERIIDRTITVMRLKGIKEGSKVTDIAKKYVDKNTPYAMMSLPFIGVYLLCKDITCDIRFQKFICKIVKLGLEGLIGMIYREDIGGTLPMVCSQYVYHCYKEAGQDYEIQLNTNQNSVLNRVKKILQTDRWTKDGTLQQLSESYFSKNNQKIETDKIECINEELYKELADIMKQTKVNQIELQQLNKDDELEDEFVICTYTICKTLCDLINKQYNLMTSQDSPCQVVETIQALSEYFITPGDLKSNTKNLECLGILDQSSFK